MSRCSPQIQRDLGDRLVSGAGAALDIPRPEVRPRMGTTLGTVRRISLSLFIEVKLL